MLLLILVAAHLLHGVGTQELTTQSQVIRLLHGQAMEALVVRLLVGYLSSQT